MNRYRRVPSESYRGRRKRQPLKWLLIIPILIFGAYAVLAKESQVAIPVPTPTPADPRFEQFKGECTTYGIKNTRIGSAEDREKVFGTANDKASLVTVDFFNYAVQVHRKVAPCLEAVQRDLKNQGVAYEIHEIGGYRPEREDRPYWFHQYGAGIDINPPENPQCLDDGEGVDPAHRCDTDSPYEIPKEWVETFRRYGFYWGGDYPEKKDYMHFEWRGGEL